MAIAYGIYQPTDASQLAAQYVAGLSLPLVLALKGAYSVPFVYHNLNGIRHIVHAFIICTIRRCGTLEGR